MKTSQTIQQLRPETPVLDPEWSARTLRSIVAKPPTKRRVRRIAIGAAAVVLTTGGIAYASGMVPAFISDEFDWISNSEVSDAHRVASFTLDVDGPGRTIEIWRARNAEGEVCTITHQARGRFGPESDGYCGVEPVHGWFGWTAESSRRDEPMPDSTLYVYGERPAPDVTSVRAYGPGFDHTIPVDPTTGGFASAVPEVTLAEHGEVAGRIIATLEFKNAAGDVVSTNALKER